MKIRAAITSASLSVLFLIVYGTTNWLASTRRGVRSFYFGWERAIPFVPALIVPYMSLDLFFVGAPFLCTSRREMRTLAIRIATAIIIAGFCFAVFPLRFAFQRPAVSGWLGAVFNTFRQMDQPFNQYPSLHIALCMIVGEVYLRRARGVLRWIITIWFILIGLSAVLTFQHHVIDVLGGATLGVICLHFIQDEPMARSGETNRKAGVSYAIGGALCMIAGCSYRPWMLALLWPAASLFLISAAYFAGIAGIYRKRGGKLPWTTQILFFWPLAGQRISLLHYARRGSAWGAVTDRLWIGRKLSGREARAAMKAGANSVLDLTGEFTEAAPFRRTNYLQLAILDLTAPSPAQLDLALNFIANHVLEGNVYVHCKAGYSRTAAVAGAYLLQSGAASSPDEAIAMLRRARNHIVIRSEAENCIRRFAETLTGSGA